MPPVQELEEQQAAVVAEANTLIASLEGRLPEGEEADKLRGFDERFKELGEQIVAGKEHEERTSRFRTAGDEIEKARAAGRPPIYAPEPQQEIAEELLMTPGEMFVRSAAYQNWMAKYPDGGPSGDLKDHSDAADVGAYRAYLGLRSPTERLRMGESLDPRKDRFRALFTPASQAVTRPNMLAPTQWMGLMDPGLTRPLTVRDVVTVLPITGDMVEYVRELSRVHGAAPVATATALTGTSGTKPEGGITFEVKTQTVKTIAEWVAATKRILSDVGYLRGYIDQYLTYDVSLTLEDQMITGAGTGENFLGILNDPGIQTQVAPSGGQNLIDVLRFGRRKVIINGRAFPSAVLINPADTEKIDVLKASTAGTYLGANPFQWSPNQNIWGMTLIESEAVPANTALVGDFRRAILFDRESTTISVGTANDDFIRNLIRILAEMRAAFGVIRPSAFCAVTLS